MIAHLISGQCIEAENKSLILLEIFNDSLIDFNGMSTRLGLFYA